MDHKTEKSSEERWLLFNQSMELMAYLQPIRFEEIAQINPIYQEALIDLAQKRYVAIHDGVVELTLLGDVKFIELLELMIERDAL